VTTITLGIDELKQLIADAVRVGVSAALHADKQPTPPIQPGSFMARKAAALELREKKNSRHKSAQAA